MKIQPADFRCFGLILYNLSKLTLSWICLSGCIYIVKNNFSLLVPTQSLDLLLNKAEHVGIIAKKLPLGVVEGFAILSVTARMECLTAIDNTRWIRFLL